MADGPHNLGEQVHNQQLARYAERLAILSDIDRAILSLEAPQAIAQHVVVRLRQMIPCEYTAVLLDDDDGTAATLIAADALGPPPPIGRRFQIPPEDRLDEIPYGQAQVEAFVDYAHYMGAFADVLRLRSIRSFVRMPLSLAGKKIGILALLAREPNAFDAEAVATIIALGNQLAVAVHCTRLIEREQQARRFTERLHTIGMALSTSLDPSEVFTMLLDALAELVPYDTANIMLRSDEYCFRIKALRHYDAWTDSTSLWTFPFDIRSVGPIRRLVEQQATVFIPDTAADPEWVRLPGTEHVCCWIGVPLLAQGQLIGLFSLDHSEPWGFSTDHVRTAELLAASAGIAIANAQLFAQSQREIEERRQAEAALEQERALLAQRVTERTADLRAANQELARAVQLKDEFLANMSHELRTPLNAILGRSELLREQIYGTLTPRQDHAIQSIEESGRHLLSLINDILDLSKVEAGKLEISPEVCEVEDLCRSVIRMVKQLALSKQISLSSHFDPTVTNIIADPRRLKQILVNLLSNAVKFTPKGGSVGLEVEGNLEHERVTFTVWDTGIGIATHDQARLFQPFVQIDSSLSRTHSGSGLGLALVLRLTKLHQGSISLTSSPGHGSRFEVLLPWRKMTFGSLRTSTDQATPQPDGSAEGITQITPLYPAPLVLLVEDHSENIAVMSDYLDQLGCTFHIAHDGIAAIHMANALQPSIILMDIQIPCLDGLEAMRHIRANGLQDTPIIALTALTMPGDRERCMAAGANAYIAKPVSLRGLRAEMVRLLG
ncbi:hybrid sensor histidine kinase/response regulator [Candidatus Viridilinea mediisalina]|nr:ATP-binding protein [Candidatus Viridilinea mediisalina]